MVLFLSTCSVAGSGATARLFYHAAGSFCRQPGSAVPVAACLSITGTKTRCNVGDGETWEQVIMPEAAVAVAKPTELRRHLPTRLEGAAGDSPMPRKPASSSTAWRPRMVSFDSQAAHLVTGLGRASGCAPSASVS